MKEHIAKFRAFNRFYTPILGLLNQHYLESGYSLSEVRILFEINFHKGITASELIAILKLDKGYLSRMLLQFEKKSMVARTKSKHDQRSQLLTLTEKGKKVFKALNKKSEDQAAALLNNGSDRELQNLTTHMHAIQQIIETIHARSHDKN